ncbi:AAA family ATPase [Gordonia sp. CPCC 206044]|uniref:helix-turn-helix transcriptional regulator n=1 Tax=Gordonia sp. CPCC 206044 TaxID=3140793 RepID=UPI003AF3A5A4
MAGSGGLLVDWPLGVVDLVGRDDEVVELSRFIDTAVIGGSPTAVLVGDPGVGKSAVLGTVAALADRRGLRVLRGRGVAFESSVQLALLHELLLPILDGQAVSTHPAVPTLRVALGLADGPPTADDDLCAAVIDLVGELAAVTPMIIVVDDLHLADDTSVRILGAVCDAEPPGLGVVTVATPSSWLMPARFGRVELRPLSDAASNLLVRQAYPNIADDVRSRLISAARGNPRVLVGLPAGWRDAQISGLESLPPVLPMSAAMSVALFPRLPELPTLTRRLILMHLFVPGADVDLFAPAFGDREMTSVAAPALAHDLVIVLSSTAPDGATVTRIRLRQPLFGVALMASATPEERSGVHRALGQCATALGVDPVALWRVADSTTGFDEELASRMECAGEAAMLSAQWRAALRLLDRATELTADPAERLRRLSRTTQVAARVNPKSASVLFDEMCSAAAGSEGSLVTALAAATVVAGADDGDVDAAHDIVVRAIDAYPGHHDPDDPVLAEAVEELRSLCWLGGRAELWADHRRILRRIGPTLPPLQELSSAVAARPTKLSDPERERLDILIGTVAEQSSPLWIVEVAEMAAVFDRVEDTRAALMRLVDDPAERGAGVPAIWALLMLAHDDFHRGRWDRTVEKAERARRSADSGGHDQLWWMADYLLALVAAVRGDIAAVGAAAHRMRVWAAPRRAATVGKYADHVQMLVAAARADVETAYFHATSIGPAEQLVAGVPLAREVAMDVVRVCVRTGRFDEARAHVDAMDRLDLAGLSPRMHMLHLAARAQVAGPEAADLYRQALAVPTSQRWRFDHARVQFLYGSHLRRGQAVAASRAVLGEALASFEALGAAPWSARVAAELDATARTRSRTGRTASPLTAHERRIAEMAAHGLSNKMIAERLDISSRTVGNHLHRVYAKVGVSSRGALRDVLDSPVADVGVVNSPESRSAARDDTPSSR